MKTEKERPASAGSPVLEGRSVNSRLQELAARGQSPWVHGLTRAMLDDGTLAALIEAGVRGAAMDPVEVGRAVADDHCYDERLRSFPPEADDREAYFRLLIADARAACDALGPCALLGSGRDGWVSAGIDPDNARDTAAALAQAVWLHGEVGRPNFMVQIPATVEGLPAIEECAARGIPVDATLLYSQQRHGEVANAYLTGLWRFLEAGGAPAGIGSVASFPLTWLDAEADRRLAAVAGPEDLRATMAIANAKLAHRAQEKVFSGGRWEDLVAAGASPQYCRWTATSPRDLAAADDVRYVEMLIGPDSVCTMSPQLLRAFCDHGEVSRDPLDAEVEEAALTLDRFTRADVHYADVTEELERWSLAQLAAAFHETVSLIGAVRDELNKS